MTSKRITQMKVACILLSPQKALPIDFQIIPFAEACLRFSPQIAIREPNTVFIEIGKCSLLYSERSFLARVQVLLRRFGVDAKIAIAGDLPSSLALARYGVQGGLDALPLDALEYLSDPFGTDPLGRKSVVKMIEALKRLGIETLRQFKTISPSQIPSRFGGLGLYCRQQMEGTVCFPWPYWRPPEKFLERIDLLPSEFCSELEPLLFKAKQMLDRLFSRLRGRMLRAERIRFSLELEKYSTIKNPLREWTFELICPQSSTGGFIPILRERLNWDLGRTPIESYIIAMSCHILSTTPAQSLQRSLLNTRENFEYEEAIGSLFNQLEEYLGKDCVFWARVTEERFPEKSWVKAKQKNEPQADLNGRYPKRPTRVFKTPIPITVIQDRIIFRRRSFKSVHWSRVERLSLDWIDDVPARNYYRVDLEGGRSLWIFSEAPGHYYFAHGYFE